MDEMKRNSLKIPTYASRSSVNQKETGLREEANQHDPSAQDHLDARSEAAASEGLNMGTDGSINATGEASPE